MCLSDHAMNYDPLFLEKLCDLSIAHELCYSSARCEYPQDLDVIVSANHRTLTLALRGAQ